jgi:uncharacterized protein (UPF0335 family)
MEALGNNSVERLRSYVERVARKKEVQKEAGEDIKEILLEAKAAGFKPATISQLAKELIMTDEQRDKAAANKEDLEMCRAALGGLADMPLGEAAIRAVA